MIDDNEKNENLVVFVGLLCLDIVNYVDEYPVEDSDQRCEQQSITTGGNAANNCKVWRQLSAERPCLLFASFGDDWASTISRNLLHAESIDLSICSKRSNQSMSVSIVLVNKRNGSRTILHNKKNLHEPTFEEFREKLTDELMQKICWIHFEGRNIAEILKMIDYVVGLSCRVQRHKPIISVELEKPKPSIAQLAKLADFVFLGKDFAQSCGYTNASDAVRHFFGEHVVKAKGVFCAWGEKGACAMSPKDGVLFECPSSAHGLAIVDTLGAGDTFIAACICKLIQNDLDLKSALDYGCFVAGAKCCIQGFSGLGDFLKRIG